MTRGAWQIMNAVVMQKNITYKAFSWLFFCCCWICCCSTSMFSSESSVVGFSSKFETCDGFVVKLRQKSPLRFDQIRSMHPITISAELLSESFAAFLIKISNGILLYFSDKLFREEVLLFLARVFLKVRYYCIFLSFFQGQKRNSFNSKNSMEGKLSR